MGERPPIPRSRRAAASLVWGLHIVVTVFLAVGWAFPWPLAWRIYVLGAPFVVVGWWIFSDACWLSLVEAWLRGERSVTQELETGRERARSFVAETLSGITGRPVSHRLGSRLSYGAVTTGFVVSSFRLWLS